MYDLSGKPVGGTVPMPEMAGPSVFRHVIQTATSSLQLHFVLGSPTIYRYDPLTGEQLFGRANKYL